MSGSCLSKVVSLSPLVKFILKGYFVSVPSYKPATLFSFFLIVITPNFSNYRGTVNHLHDVSAFAKAESEVTFSAMSVCVYV